MYLECLPCNVRHGNCYYWYRHLNSPEHQAFAKEAVNNCSSEMSNRSIVCYQFNKEKMTKVKMSDFTAYFGKFGLIHDIYYKTSLNDSSITACLVLMDSVELAKRITFDLRSISSSDDGHRVKDVIRFGVFKLRPEISPTQFQNVMKIRSEEIFQQRHDNLVRICENISLEQQFYEFICATTISTEQEKVRKEFIQKLETVLSREFGNCELLLYGSYFIGLADQHGSDLDIFVNPTGESTNQQNLNHKSKESGDVTKNDIFERTLRCIRRKNSWEQRQSKKPWFRRIIPIYARVPIIRLTHEATELQCDLSFSSVLSVHNSHLMKFYIQFDPRVHPLMMFLRYWGRYHSLLGSNKIKPYALMLLAVVFLNQEKILPNVAFLENNYVGEPVKLEGWNAGFESNVEKVRQIIRQSGYPAPSVPEELDYSDVLKLAQGFFKKFGTLDFADLVVCPLLGNFIEKNFFHDENKFQDIFASKDIFQLVKEIKLQSPMCIQDPFKLDFNVTSGVNPKQVKLFTSICRETARFLEEILAAKKGNLFSTVFVNVERLLSGQENSNNNNRVEEPFVISNWNVSAVQEVVDNSAHEVAQQKGEDEDKQQINSNREAGTVRALAENDQGNQVWRDAPNNMLHQQTFGFSSEHCISPEFEHIFMTACSCLGVTQDELTCRMKVLWTGFASDFFQRIFEKGFGLDVDIQKLPNYTHIPSFNVEEAKSRTDLLPYTLNITLDKMKGQYLIETLRRANHDDVVDDATTSSPDASPDSKRPKLEITNQEVNDNLGENNNAIGKVISSAPTSVTIATKTSSLFPESSKIALQSPISVPVDFLASREAYLKIPIGLRKPFSNVILVQGEATPFINRQFRIYDKILLDQNLPLLTLNPFTMEETATKHFKQLNESNSLAGMEVNFKCLVSINTTELVAQVHLEEKIQSPELQFPVVHLLRDLGFSKMFKQYTLYRLNKLLFKHICAVLLKN